MNFLDIIRGNIKRIRGLDDQDPLISLCEDNKDRNFLGIAITNIKPDEELVSESRSIRDHISMRIHNKKNSMDYRFKVAVKEYFGLRFLGGFHTGKYRPVYNNSTKLLTYPGFEVRCRSFENNDPFKKNHDGLKKLSKKLD